MVGKYLYRAKPNNYVHNPLLSLDNTRKDKANKNYKVNKELQTTTIGYHENVASWTAVSTSALIARTRALPGSPNRSFTRAEAAIASRFFPSLEWEV